MSSHLRLIEPGLSESLESAMRRFFAPLRFELDNPPLDMRLDIAEREGAYQIKADLPGVKKEDINVRIDGNVVQIDAEIKQEKETKSNGGRLLRCERYHGSVSRSFSLAQDVDEGKAQAKYVDGVLTLDLPKKASAAGRKLAVQ